MAKLPKIIQGGMGFFVSGPRLAKAVALCGEQGTLSGVCLEIVLARLLQTGDPGGDIRRALATCPLQAEADEVVREYFVEGGVPDGQTYREPPMMSIKPSRSLINLVVCANYAFVWLAKEGHNGVVSVNYLEKVALPHVYAIYGAMLAGVDHITMGAGIPLQIPSVIEAYMLGQAATYRVPVDGVHIKSHAMTFDPTAFFGHSSPLVKKPGFIPIVASNALAQIFLKKLPPEQRVTGFVVEEPTAGGHNAPPRTPPDYGPKDLVDYHKLAELGVPFWIGGACASPEKLAWALSVGAEGIQVGSIFSLCEESGFNPKIRRRVRELGYLGKLRVRTDNLVSPTGFPFKLVELAGTITDPEVFAARRRVCDKGALFTLYEKADGSIGSRCPSEPVAAYVAKGGRQEDTNGRGCICNGLCSVVNIGGAHEPSIVTQGDDYAYLPRVMSGPYDTYHVVDAVKYLLGK